MVLKYTVYLNLLRVQKYFHRQLFCRRSLCLTSRSVFNQCFLSSHPWTNRMTSFFRTSCPRVVWFSPQPDKLQTLKGEKLLMCMFVLSIAADTLPCPLPDRELYYGCRWVVCTTSPPVSGCCCYVPNTHIYDQIGSSVFRDSPCYRFFCSISILATQSWDPM